MKALKASHVARPTLHKHLLFMVYMAWSVLKKKLFSHQTSHEMNHRATCDGGMIDYYFSKRVLMVCFQQWRLNVQKKSTQRMY